MHFSVSLLRNIHCMTVLHIQCLSFSAIFVYFCALLEPEVTNEHLGPFQHQHCCFSLHPGWHYRLVGERGSMFMQRRRSTAFRIPSLLRRKWRQVRHTLALEKQFRKWESMDGDDRCCIQISRYQGGNQHAYVCTEWQSSTLL